MVFDPGQVKGRTAANGVVRVTIDTTANGLPLVIKVNLHFDLLLNVRKNTGMSQI